MRKIFFFEFLVYIFFRWSDRSVGITNCVNLQLKTDWTARGIHCAKIRSWNSQRKRKKMLVAHWIFHEKPSFFYITFTHFFPLLFASPSSPCARAKRTKKRRNERFAGVCVYGWVGAELALLLGRWSAWFIFFGSSRARDGVATFSLVFPHTTLFSPRPSIDSDSHIARDQNFPALDTREGFACACKNEKKSHIHRRCRCR